MPDGDVVWEVLDLVARWKSAAMCLLTLCKAIDQFPIVDNRGSFISIVNHTVKTNESCSTVHYLSLIPTLRNFTAIHPSSFKSITGHPASLLISLSEGRSITLLSIIHYMLVVGSSVLSFSTSHLDLPPFLLNLRTCEQHSSVTEHRSTLSRCHQARCMREDIVT